MTLSDAELYDTAELFGVDLDQVRRDHVISHALAAISTRARGSFLFTGGTMLSRTWLHNLRLSEDIDLMVYPRRRVAGDELAQALDAELTREFGPPAWSKDPREAGDAESIYLSVGEDVTIKFQLVDTAGRPPWPSEAREIHQRYSDAPPATLNVPTSDAVVAMKLTAWVDRRAERDLYDLWAMAERGMVTPGAAAIYYRHGQSPRPFNRAVFQNPPSAEAWDRALGHQCRLGATPDEAIEAIGDALDRIGAIADGYRTAEDDDEDGYSRSRAWLSGAQTRRLPAAQVNGGEQPQGDDGRLARTSAEEQPGGTATP